MSHFNKYQPGTHFLQIPGPTNIPDRILRAISKPIIDHRGPEFAELTFSLLKRLKQILKTSSHVIIYPSSGTGVWEAALVNILSPGDKILAFETGHFATLWKNVAVNLGLEVEFVAGDWRSGVNPQVVEGKLLQDTERQIKAIQIVHNETSTGITSRIQEIRQAMDRANHPALLLVDAISSLGCADYSHDEWRVDVTISASQKGLMLPPGLGFHAVSNNALEDAKKSKFPKSYWDWAPILANNEKGFFPYTPATNLLFGLDEALTMLFEEGLENVFERHNRLAATTRCAVDAWDLQNLCLNSEEYSNSTTAVLMPDSCNADELRQIILERFNMSLGTGLGKVKGKVFRIGHLGDMNELMLAGTLSGIEMGLSLVGVPHKKGGIDAALNYLQNS